MRTRQQIIEADPLVQKRLRYQKERSEEDNGDKVHDLEAAEIETENRILLLQIEDSVHDVKEEVIQVKERQVAFPSILYQVIKIPQMGWPLLLAVLLIMWLVSRLGSEGIGALAAYFGIEAAPETGVVILIGALGFVSMLGYTKYLNNKGEQK